MAAQSVTEPRAQAGAPGILAAGLNVGDRRVVIDRLGKCVLWTIQRSFTTVGRVQEEGSLTHTPRSLFSCLVNRYLLGQTANIFLIGSHPRDPLAVSNVVLAKACQTSPAFWACSPTRS